MGHGGGKSPHTLRMLRALLHALQRDNAKAPVQRTLFEDEYVADRLTLLRPDGSGTCTCGLENARLYSSPFANQLICLNCFKEYERDAEFSFRAHWYKDEDPAGHL